MSYIIAKQVAKQLTSNYDIASKVLNSIDGINSGEMGLTPDSIKNSSKYRIARAAMDKAFTELRAYNANYTKQYKKEIQADRLARRYAA
jgi:hypothetical protein